MIYIQVDTFLAFFRAYRDEKGILIYSLATIRKQYIRSGWFFLNLIACFPGTIIGFIVTKSLTDEQVEAMMEGSPTVHRVLFIFEMFKLLRLVRFKKLITQSLIISRLWEVLNIETTLVLKFMFLIALFSHWIACLWGLIAFFEARSFGNELSDTVNWISNWVNNSYVEGGLNPIGWENYMSRYWLCLFWAIQSITSIGYGNITPVTTGEYAYANFLMLACGVFWAYIIGALVEAVASMGTVNKEYITKMNEANQMVADFTTEKLPISKSGSLFDVKVSKRVRRFITNQRDRATTKSMESKSAESLEDKYTTLGILSPELRKICVLHLVHSLIETIPYLSSKYMTPDEQAKIALNSFLLEFAAGEKFRAHDEFGRGILIFQQGLAIAMRHNCSKAFHWRKCPKNYPLDVGEVLVEDDFFESEQLAYHFAGFAKVFFIPRTVVVSALEKNEKAWKECARWKYLSAALILKSQANRKSRLESV
jgi:hypothetical protein